MVLTSLFLGLKTIALRMARPIFIFAFSEADI